MRSTYSQSTIRRWRAAPSGCGSRRRRCDEDMARLVSALQDVWQTLGLGLRAAAE
jgi:hypothetical protein